MNIAYLISLNNHAKGNIIYNTGFKNSKTNVRSLYCYYKNQSSMNHSSIRNRLKTGKNKALLIASLPLNHKLYK